MMIRTHKHAADIDLWLLFIVVIYYSKRLGYFWIVFSARISKSSNKAQACALYFVPVIDIIHFIVMKISFLT